MKKLLFNARQSLKLKKILYVFVVLFTFIYIFSIPSFSGQKSIVHYISYFSMIMLAIFTLLYIVLFSKFSFKWQLFIVPSFALFSIIGTIVYSHEYRSFLTLILLSLSFFVFYFSFTIIRNKNLILCIIVAAITLFALYFIFIYRNELMNFKDYGRDKFRLGFYFDNPNAVSATCVVGISSSIYLLLFCNRRLKYLCLISILLITIVGFSTGSRTFFLAFAVVFPVLLYFKFRRHKIGFFIVLSFFLIVAIVLFNLPFLSTIKFRILNAFETLFGISSKADNSTVSRFAMMQYGFDLGAKNLIFGYGIRGFGIVSNLYTYAHSNFAEVICDFGLVGAILFYLPLLIVLGNCIQNGFKNSSIIIPFFVYYMVASLSNVFYYNKMYYLILSMLYFFSFNFDVKKVSIKK